eukprot:365747-Chlamydomonas_euryale.AAC.20
MFGGSCTPGGSCRPGGSCSPAGRGGMTGMGGPTPGGGCGSGEVRTTEAAGDRDISGCLSTFSDDSLSTDCDTGDIITAGACPDGSACAGAAAASSQLPCAGTGTDVTFVGARSSDAAMRERTPPRMLSMAMTGSSDAANVCTASPRWVMALLPGRGSGSFSGDGTFGYAAPAAGY